LKSGEKLFLHLDKELKGWEKLMIRYLLCGIIFVTAAALPLAQAASKHEISGVEARQRQLIESNIKAYTGLTRFFVISISFPGAERIGGHHQDFVNWLEYHIQLYAGHKPLTVKAPLSAQVPDVAQLLSGAYPAKDYVFVRYRGVEDKAAVRAAIERALGLAPSVGFRYTTDYWSVPE
jgi:hypothetical protein